MSETGASELRALVVQCLERMEARESGVLEDLCRAHPQHAAALRRRISVLQGVGLMGGDEPFVQPGQRLGDFQLVQRLGQGGMGVVYLARQLSLDREVALKLIRPDHLFSEQARARFQREVALAAALQHPGIVPVYTVDEENGLPFFVMERVRGATLGEVVAELGDRPPQTLVAADLGVALAACMHAAGFADVAADSFEGHHVECCLALVQQAALALEHAHGRGVLHRDVKPSNLMLTPEGRVLLMDFGLASTADASRLTGTGHLLGSLHYMAPEQHQGEEADERTDVFGLGVTLYELLTLTPPFEGRSAAELASAVLLGDPAPLRERNPNVALDVETVCLKAMDPDPARRYATAGDFARDLGHLLAHEPIEARRLGWGLRLQRWSQRHPALTLSFFVALVLFAVGLGAVALQSRRANRRLAVANDDLGVAVDKALGAVDRMLARVGGQLRDVPQAQTLRAEVMDDALELFEEVEQLGPISDFRRRQWADLYNFKADAQLVIGDHQGAAESFRQGIALLERLVEESPEVELYLALARARGFLGKVHVEDGRDGEAAREYEAADRAYGDLLTLEPEHELALQNREQLRFNLLNLRVALGQLEPAVELGRRIMAASEERVARAPGDPAPGLWLAINRYFLADNLILLEQHDEAFALYEQALGELGALLEHGGRIHEIPFRFSECADNYGLALALDGHLEDAQAVLAEGLEVAAGLIADYPDNDEYRFRFARLHNSLGETQVLLSRPDLAQASFEAALFEHERLVQRTPDSARRRNRKSEALMNLGASLSWLGEPEAARATLEQAIEEQRKVVAASPGHPEYDRVMGTAHVELGVALLELGDPEAAAASLEGLLDWCGDDEWTIGQLMRRLRRGGLVPPGFEGGDDKAGYEALVEILRTAE